MIGGGLFVVKKVVGLGSEKLSCKVYILKNKEKVKI